MAFLSLNRTLPLRGEGRLRFGKAKKLRFILLFTHLALPLQYDKSEAHTLSGGTGNDIPPAEQGAPVGVARRKVSVFRGGGD